MRARRELTPTDLAPSVFYASTERGWFRLTFTVAPPIFQEGLRRVEAVLGLGQDQPLTPFDRVSFDGGVDRLASQMHDVRLECCS